MYAKTFLPLVNFNVASFLNAEFGFLGVLKKSLIQIPFFCGHRFKAGAFFLEAFVTRDFFFT